LGETVYAGDLVAWAAGAQAIDNVFCDEDLAFLVVFRAAKIAVRVSATHVDHRMDKVDVALGERKKVSPCTTSNRQKQCPSRARRTPALFLAKPEEGPGAVCRRRQPTTAAPEPLV
jgi:hypothetical protein